MYGFIFNKRFKIYSNAIYMQYNHKAILVNIVFY